MEHSKFNLPYERALPEDDIGEPHSPMLRKILAMWRESFDYWEPIYRVGRRDKQFCQSKQWAIDVENERNKYGIATVTWPLIRSYYNHQVGKALPGSVDFHAVNVSPGVGDISEDSDANLAAINVTNGMIRFIDKQSKADAHRRKARRDQFAAGIGWLGMDWLPSDSPEEGELRVFTPKYFDEVFIDPNFRDPDAADAMYAFHPVAMPWDEAVGRYGDRIKKIAEKDGSIIELNDIKDCERMVSTLSHCKEKEWLKVGQKQIVVASHYWRRKATRTVVLFNDKVYDEEQWKELKETAEEADIDISEAETKKYEGWIVERRMICGWSILEEEKYFINQIPWTPIFGYTQEDGEQYTFHGIVHDGVNLQEHANWLASQHATKTSKAKTIALVAGGVLDDGATPMMTRGGIEFYSVDMGEDGTGQNAAQVITSPDDGTKELEYLKFTIELLRAVMSTDNDTGDNQLIRSASQLNLHISDRDSVREELDQNYRMALECHYTKVIAAIQALYEADEVVRVVQLNEHEERIGTARFLESQNFSRYVASVKMTPSGTAQKYQSQQIADALVKSGDPSKVTMGLILGVDNTELSNKRELMKRLYKQQFAAGMTIDIPPEMLQEIMAEVQENGQITQILQKMAQPMAQEMLQQMLQDKAIQAQLAEAESKVATSAQDVERSTAIADKARIDAQRAFATDTLQLQQQQEQTKQDILRTQRQFYDLQQEIAQARADGVQITADLIDRIMEIQIPIVPPPINGTFQ